MDITNIILISLQIAGNVDGIGLLLNWMPGYEYIDGKKSSVSTFIKYEIVFMDNGFEKVIVKIPGTKPIVTAEQMAQQKGKIKVKCKNLTGKFYRANSGEYKLSCSAEGIEVV